MNLVFFSWIQSWFFFYYYFFQIWKNILKCLRIHNKWHWVAKSKCVAIRQKASQPRPSNGYRTVRPSARWQTRISSSLAKATWSWLMPPWPIRPIIHVWPKTWLPRDWVLRQLLMFMVRHTYVKRIHFRFRRERRIFRQITEITWSLQCTFRYYWIIIIRIFLRNRCYKVQRGEP